MTQFMPASDKENGDQMVMLNYKNTSHRQLSNIAGKLLSSQRESVQWKTTDHTLGCGIAFKGTSQTRKALGDLNRASPGEGHKVAVPDFLKPPMSRCTERQVENDSQPKHNKQVQDDPQTSKEDEDYPEIEQIPQYECPEDDFSDIWHPDERPDSYISQMMDYRPVCLYPCRDLARYDTNRDSSLLENKLDSSLEDFSLRDVTLDDRELEMEPDVCYLDMLPPSPDDI